MDAVSMKEMFSVCGSYIESAEYFRYIAYVQQNIDIGIDL